MCAEPARFQGHGQKCLSQRFYRHRSFRHPFLLQREAPPTTRVAATATFSSPMSTKRPREFFFLQNLTFLIKTNAFTSSSLPHMVFHILATKSLLPHLGYHILATTSWLTDPDFHILAAISWLPNPGLHILSTRSWLHILDSTSWLPHPDSQDLVYRI